MTLATLLVDAAGAHGERPALAHRGARISYRELDAAAARAAGALRELGVGRGDRVAFVLPNEPASVAAYHGALQLGAVVVPLNPLLRANEIGRRVADAGAVLLEPAGLDGPPVDAVASLADEDAAVILYTSGTTGDPRRTELTQGGLRRVTEYLARDALGLREDDVLFGCAPLAHVFGMTGCMNGALAAGACLALVARFEPAAALEEIEREGAWRISAARRCPSRCWPPSRSVSARSCSRATG